LTTAHFFPQLHDPAAQPQLAHEQEAFPQPPIVMFVMLVGLGLRVK